MWTAGVFRPDTKLAPPPAVLHSHLVTSRPRRSAPAWYGSGWGLPFVTWSAVTRWWCSGTAAVGSAIEAYFVVADVTMAQTGLGAELSWG